MRILQRYLTGKLIWTSLLALFVMVSLFSFFTLIDQLEDTGRGDYGIAEAIIYTALTMPRIAYDVFPIAAVIGSMAVLGILSRNSELEVILTSGLSRYGLTWILVKSSMLLVVVALVIGELVAPAAEEHAQDIRAFALTENTTLKSRYGFWIRDGNSYINIRRMLPGNRIEDIYYYEFDGMQNLRSSFHAASAVFQDGKWLMQDIQETSFAYQKVGSRALEQALWESPVRPEILNVVDIKPRYLSMLGLANYIIYLKKNAQDTLIYEQALWAKLVKPFSILAMIALAVPLVARQSRQVAVGQRVFVGTLAGIGFHIFTQVCENLGVVYQINPGMSVATPTVILTGLIIFLMRKSL